MISVGNTVAAVVVVVVVVAASVKLTTEVHPDQHFLVEFYLVDKDR